MAQTGLKFGGFLPCLWSTLTVVDHWSQSPTLSLPNQNIPVLIPSQVPQDSVI